MNSLSALLDNPAGLCRRDFFVNAEICAEQTVSAENAKLSAPLDWRLQVQAFASFLQQDSYSEYLICCADSRAQLLSMLAIWRAGKRAILAANEQAQTLTNLLANTASRAVITDHDLIISPTYFLPSLNFSARMTNAELTTNTSSLSASAIALVLYTSGSSGEPKAVTRSLVQLQAEITQLEQQFGARIGPAAIVMGTVPTQHVYGLVFRLLWPLAAGRQVISASEHYPEQLLKSIAVYSDVVLISSPAHLERWSEHYELTSIAANLSLIFSSGAPLSGLAAHKIARQCKQAPVEVLGSTETGGVAWRQRKNSGLDGNADTAEDERWQAFNSVQLRLSPLENVLELRSPAAYTQDWCALGDRAQMCSANQFYLLGRADRIVKIEGKRVSLLAFEQAFTAHPDIAEAAVCVLAAPREQIAAVIVLNAAGCQNLKSGSRRIYTEKLRQYLLQTFELVVLPRRFRFVDRLPIDARGKLTHLALSAFFSSNRSVDQIQKPSAAYEKIVEMQPLTDHSMFARGELKLPEIIDLKQDGKAVIYHLRVPENLSFFPGHFPDTPILPGVVQVDWAEQFCRQHWQWSASFHKLEQLKFQAVIRPGYEIHLRLDFQSDPIRITFCYDSISGRHSSGRIVYRDGVCP